MPTDSAPVEGGRDRRGRESRSDGEAERRLVDAVRRDLTEAFPLLSAHQVSAVVERVWSEFRGARIRDFVPLLVRKQARAELREQVGVDTDSPASAPRSLVGPAGADSPPEHPATPGPDAALPRSRTVRVRVEHARP